MSPTISTEKTPKRPRSKYLWPSVLAVVVFVYLFCWLITAAFAPQDMNDWFAKYYEKRISKIRNGEEEVEFHTNVPFSGRGFDFGPDRTFVKKWFFCVGRPTCPAPFIIGADIAYVNGPLSGWAGTIYFMWTPFGLKPISERRVWVS